MAQARLKIIEPQPDPSDVVLEMTDITKSFPGVKALEGVSLAVRKGEVHGLVGENGAGKSTLMRILSGAFLANSGQLRLGGQVIDSPNPSLMIEKGVAVIYQEFAQAPHLSVAENIFLNRMPRAAFGRINWDEAYRQAKAALQHLGFDIDPRAIVSELSVAQRQIVEIARAISRNARLIVLDEPSAVLGDAELEKLFRTIRTLQAEGVAFIYISHRLKEVFELCQTVTVLRDGRCVAVRPTPEWDTQSLIQSMVGRAVADYFPARNANPGDVVLKVENLTRGRSVRGATLTLRKGEILGICGLAGAGRTELLRAIYGADTIDSGSVKVHGRPQAVNSPRRGIALGMGFVPEDRKTEGLFLSQSVRFNITLSRLSNFQRSGKLDLRAEKEAVSALTRQLTVKTPSIESEIRTLSGGNQQKCAIAKQLNAKCDILLIDEPTRGVDVGARREIYELLVRLVEEEGLAILMVSSELPEIIGMCDRILVMREGEITAELPRGATEEDIMKYATFH
ncbi:MAG: D-xylose ABC transporter ATP-binding protein [Cereibacter sphaeroides]|uniref:D-xylose ABC transporter ATP-binding protein n=1 Tax=Cereibacter sphaeroides TaxID=1063 RepID=A0A2W5SGF7_CERSP|nr:MAG: D-xylose ABC transporter ATP-binding protein [Cereibacter sphaeroides]